jgi:hypothetical protein
VKIPDPPAATALERLCQRLIMIRGWFVILYNRVRKSIGLSYYATRDPWVAGLSDGSYERDEFVKTLNLPAWHEVTWTVAGQIACQSGRLILTDPIEFPTTKPPNGVVVSGVPAGAHRIELQRVSLGRGYGRVVLRARVLWGEMSDPDFHYLGAVGVDLGAISIADFGETSRASPKEAESSGFDPIGLLGEGEYYAAVDPIASGRPFLHLFQTGFGDGYYPVLRIDCDGKSCGILIDMTNLLDATELEAPEKSGTERPQPAAPGQGQGAGRIYRVRRLAR